MDETMLGTPPTLKAKGREKVEPEELTRRRFLSLMFGYLSLLSFFLYFFGAFVDLLRPNLVALMPVAVYAVIKWVCLAAYLFLVANLSVTTLLGLYYMTERIHKTETKLIVTEP